jgi:hypothetical protein
MEGGPQGRGQTGARGNKAALPSPSSSAAAAIGGGVEGEARGGGRGRQRAGMPPPTPPMPPSPPLPPPSPQPDGVAAGGAVRPRVLGQGGERGDRRARGVQSEPRPTPPTGNRGKTAGSPPSSRGMPSNRRHSIGGTRSCSTGTHSARHGSIDSTRDARCRDIRPRLRSSTKSITMTNRLAACNHRIGSVAILLVVFHCCLYVLVFSFVTPWTNTGDSTVFELAARRFYDSSTKYPLSPGVCTAAFTSRRPDGICTATFTSSAGITKTR